MPRAIVDASLVEEVRNTVRKYPSMPGCDIGKLCGTSAATVSRIMNGAYDYLLGGGASAKEDPELVPLLHEANVYLRTIAFALLAEMDNDVKVTHDMCTRWRKGMNVKDGDGDERR